MGIHAAFWDGDMPSAFGLVVVTPEVAVSDEFLHCAYNYRQRLDGIIIDDAYSLFNVGYEVGKLSKLELPVTCLASMVPPAIIPIFEGYLSVGRFQEIRFQLGTHILTRGMNYNVDICDDILSGLNRIDFNPEVLSVVFCSSEGQAEDIADTIGGFIYIEEMGLEDREATLQDWALEKGVLVSTILLPTELHISNAVFLGLPASLMDWVQVRADRSTIICRMPSNEATDQESLWAIHSRKVRFFRYL